jgi:hypothetical protein
MKPQLSTASWCTDLQHRRQGWAEVAREQHMRDVRKQRNGRCTTERRQPEDSTANSTAREISTPTGQEGQTPPVKALQGMNQAAVATTM